MSLFAPDPDLPGPVPGEHLGNSSVGEFSSVWGESDPLVEGFLNHTLPKPEWTHAAHLRVGLWHLLRSPPAEALSLLRERIRTYNVATGGMNTDEAGYHETITRFFVGCIADFLATANRSAGFQELFEGLIAVAGDRDLPLRFWSRDRLMSPEARREWVAPAR